MPNRTVEIRTVPAVDASREARLVELLTLGLARSLVRAPDIDFRPQLSVYATMPTTAGADR